MHLFHQAQVLLGSVYQKHFSLSAIKENMPVHEQGLEAVSSLIYQQKQQWNHIYFCSFNGKFFEKEEYTKRMEKNSNHSL